MLKSKKGYLASEILDYKVLDRHSKDMGKISDLLINLLSYKIDYLIVGRKKKLIPVSFVNTDDSIKKVLILSQTKDRIKSSSSQKESTITDQYQYFSKVKSLIVYDIMGNKLGPITDIAYYPGLRVDFLVKKEGLYNDEINFPNCFVIPTGHLCQIHKQSMVLGVSKDEFDLVNFTGFHHLFLPYRLQHRNKRYVIVEAPINTVSYYLNKRAETLEKVSESEYLYIEELDVTLYRNVVHFVNIFNLVLATSPDTYIPLSTSDAKRYFKSGTFIVFEYYEPIGYCIVTIEKQEETSNVIGTISGIGVHPACRGRNIALTLIHKSLEYMMEKDVDLIQADIYELNLPSLRLFSSLGFSERGEIFLA